MSMDKGHSGRYIYTTIHRQFTIKPVLRAMVILWEKKMTTSVQVHEIWTCTGYTHQWF